MSGSRRYLVVTTGRNCIDRVDRCLTSIAAQRGVDVRCVVVDDASDGDHADQPNRVADLCNLHGFRFIAHDERVGAMGSQWEAWHELEPEAADVVVWVDLDDRLAHDRALERVEVEYAAGARVTYGSYRPEPESATCPAVTVYPDDIVRRRAFRAFARRGGGLRYNHLRTVSWWALRQIGADQLRGPDGEWYRSGPDCAVMIPALELAGRRHAVIPDVLYIYTSDNPYSEWRRWPEQVNADHRHVLGRRPLGPIENRRSRAR